MPLLDQVNLMCLALQEQNPPVSLAAVRRGFNFLIHLLEKGDLTRYLKKKRCPNAQTTTTYFSPPMRHIVHRPQVASAPKATFRNSFAPLSTSKRPKSPLNIVYLKNLFTFLDSFILEAYTLVLDFFSRNPIHKRTL